MTKLYSLAVGNTTRLFSWKSRGTAVAKHTADGSIEHFVSYKDFQRKIHRNTKRKILLKTVTYNLNNNLFICK